MYQLNDEETDKLDERILSEVWASPGIKFAALCERLGIDPSPKSKHDNLYRVVDRRLQAIKRDKKIKFDKGWHPIP